MQEQMSHDSANPVWQRLQWEALRKSINGLVNKVCECNLLACLVSKHSRSRVSFSCVSFLSREVAHLLHFNLQINTGNITNLVPEFFAENLIAGRGLLCRSIMKAQLASANFSHVYAAVISVINTKMPEIGELLLKRLVAQFRRAYKRNDKVRIYMCTFARIRVARISKIFGLLHTSQPHLLPLVILFAGTGTGVCQISCTFGESAGGPRSCRAGAAYASFGEAHRRLGRDGGRVCQGVRSGTD